MFINRSLNYGQKHFHGLHFGVSVFGNDWRVKHSSVGGQMKRLRDQDLELVKPNQSILVFGNIYSHQEHSERLKFYHPDRYREKNIDFYYWDNPHIPHLLYHSPSNPQGHKNWCRLVHNHTHLQTEHQVDSGAERINAQLTHLSQGVIRSWRDLVPYWRDCVVRSRRVLLCPSGAGTFHHHYHTSQGEWCKKWTTALTEMGYDVHVRVKPSRLSRRAPHRLCDVLLKENIGITVSNHSTVAIESMLSGVPAVVTGTNPSGVLGTPMKEFVETNQVRPVDTMELIAWCELLLRWDYHKKELYDGSWKHS
tara:strand:- start:1625 stop:2548 length:924 start_codon:yes stop_codon:yes gene_type:complete